MKTVHCKDCKAEWERRGEGPPKTPRPARNPGPRCVSHYRQVQRARKASTHESRVQSEYGLKPGEYGKIYLFQGGVCAICRRATGRTRRLSVDHDHKDGLTRGLLCRPCNDLLGQARDDVEFFRRAIAYLLTPPARQLGIVAVHRDNREEAG